MIHSPLVSFDTATKLFHIASPIYALDIPPPPAYSRECKITAPNSSYQPSQAPHSNLRGLDSRGIGATSSRRQMDADAFAWLIARGNTQLGEHIAETESHGILTLIT